MRNIHMYHLPQKGDRVLIRTPIAPLKHRKQQIGIVTRRDGSYVYVQPLWCKYGAKDVPVYKLTLHDLL